MSIALEFNDKMDTVIAAVMDSDGSCPTRRRADVWLAIDQAGMVVVEKSVIASLMARIEELQQ